MESLTVIKIFPSRVLAELAASLLAAEGINALVAADDAGGAYPALQPVRGVRLLVGGEDVTLAQEILNALEENGQPLTAL